MEYAIFAMSNKRERDNKGVITARILASDKSFWDNNTAAQDPPSTLHFWFDNSRLPVDRE